MKNWMLAIRPKTLFASVGPVLLGLAVAWSESRTFNILIAGLTLTCALLLQVGSNLANDYLDAVRGVDNHNRLGPLRVTSAGLITHTSMKTGLIATLGAAFLLGIYLMIAGGPVIIAVGLISIYFSYGYTGGPFPLSYNGLGELAAFIFFGPVAVFGTAYLQTHEVSRLALIAGIGPGFISGCILAINNLRDINSDTETGKRTLAVRFGEKLQRYLCISLIFLSTITGFFIALKYNAMWCLVLVILPLLFHRTWLHILYGPIDSKLNTSLQRTAQYNLLYCIVLSIGLIAKGL
jgi:1,4-dihydroxy-2-naphthoate octaprenyltransferase